MRRKNYSARLHKAKKSIYINNHRDTLKNTKYQRKQKGGNNSKITIYVNPTNIKHLLNKDDTTILTTLISRDNRNTHNNTLQKEIHIDNPNDDFVKVINTYRNILGQLCCSSHNISELDILKNRDDDLKKIWSFIVADKAENNTHNLPQTISGYDDLIKFIRYMRELLKSADLEKEQKKFGFFKKIKELPEELQKFISGPLCETVYDLKCTTELETPINGPAQAQRPGPQAQQIKPMTEDQKTKEKKSNKAAIVGMAVLGVSLAPIGIVALPFVIPLIKKGMNLYEQTLNTINNPETIANLKKELSNGIAALPDNIKKQIPPEFLKQINAITVNESNTEKLKKINDEINSNSDIHFNEFESELGNDASKLPNITDETTLAEETYSQENILENNSQNQEQIPTAEEPSVPAEEPQAPVEEPQAPVEEPQAPVEEPQAPVEEPAVPAEEPQAPVEEPAVPAEEPLATPEEPTEQLPVKEQPTEQLHVEEPQVPSGGLVNEVVSTFGTSSSTTGNPGKLKKAAVAIKNVGSAAITGIRRMFSAFSKKKTQTAGRKISNKHKKYFKYPSIANNNITIQKRRNLKNTTLKKQTSRKHRR